MPTYLYETIPENADEVPERFEVKQSMRDDALKEQPGTGRPVRRIISGGLIIPKKPASSVSSAGECCPTCH